MVNKIKKYWEVIDKWPGAIWRVGDIISEDQPLIWKDIFNLNADNYPHLLRRLTEQETYDYENLPKENKIPKR